MFRLSISCVLILIVSTLVTINGSVNAQDNPQVPNHTTVHLRWGPRPGVSRFRLQLASDRNFRDIVFDRVISGLETDINDLAPGKYTVAWHAVGDDTHKVDGKYSFEVKP